MTATLLVLTAVAAVVDWVAVARRLQRVEYVAKPLTLALLVAAAATADLGSAKLWVLAALVLGLIGDVALMLAKDEQPDAAFLIGLGSFLGGHVAYLIAFTRHGLQGFQVLAGVLIVAGMVALAMPAVIKGAAREGGQELATAVAAYGVALGAMAVLAVGTGEVATAVGGVLFLGSDIVLARERFVKATPAGPLTVIVSYHAAQLLIVIGLIA